MLNHIPNIILNSLCLTLARDTSWVSHPDWITYTYPYTSSISATRTLYWLPHLSTAPVKMNQSLKIYRHLRLSGTFSFRTAAPTPFSSHKSSKHFSISSQPDVTRRQFSSSISSVPPIATKRRKMVRSRAKDIPIQDLILSFLSFQQLVAYTTDLPPNRLILAEVKTYSGPPYW